MNLLQQIFRDRAESKKQFPISSVKLRRSIVVSLLLATTLGAQTTFTFNPNYPTIPGDTEPRTVRWDDFRNWGGSIPGANDTAIVTNSSEIVSAFQVGSARLNTTTVSGAGALEVLGNLQVNGPVTFFPGVTLRGASQWGDLDPDNASVLFYSNVDNYGNAVIAGTRANAFVMASTGGIQPVLRNHTGASLTFGGISIGGNYSRFVNETGAVLTKTGTGDATITATLQQPPGSFQPAFDQHGQINVQAGKLLINNSAGDWNGGSVSLLNNATLAFGFGLPSGTVAVNGSGLITATGDDMAGDLTLNFAANSAITLDGFHPDDVNHDLTFNGPVTLKDMNLAGDGLITFKGASTLDLRNTSGPISSTLSANTRNEGATTIRGGSDIKGLGGNTIRTWANVTGSTLTLVDRVGLYGYTRLDNAAEGTVRQQGSGTSQIDWVFDHAGILSIDTATLQLNAARHWSGNVNLTNGGTLRFQTMAPDGYATVFGRGNLEMVNAPFNQDFTLNYNSLSSTRTLLNTISIAENRTLKIDGPTRLWGTTITYGGSDFNLFNTAALELTGGVTLSAGNVPDMIVNLPIRSTGVVELDGTGISRVNVSGWTNTATGLLRKTGGGLFTIAGPLSNAGLIDVEAGTLQLGIGTRLTAGIATIAEGATLKMPAVPTGTAVLTGQGSLTFDNEAGPLSLADPLTLPISPSSRLTLANSRLTGASSFNVTQPLDFVGDELVFAATSNLVGNAFVFAPSINLTAATHWGPRLGTPTAAQQTPVVGVVSNYAAATVRGTLYAGLTSGSIPQYPYARATQPTVWENIRGATFTVGGPSGLANAPNFSADAGYLANRDPAAPGTFNNGIGSTFMAGIGGATVDWIFNSLYGTVRILNNEKLTVTRAGVWDGTTVEQFQSYLNFRNTLPMGDFVVTGAGDVGFGAKSVDSIFTLDGVTVPVDGTTIRFTGLDHGIYGNLTGSGRLKLYGDRISLASLYFDDLNNFTLTSPLWANKGGVAIHGNLLFDASAPRALDGNFNWGLDTTVDVYGQVTAHAAMVRSTYAESGFGFRIGSGGNLVLSQSDLFVDLTVNPGGRLTLIGSNNIAVYDGAIQGAVSLSGQVNVNGIKDWSGGVLTFLGGDGDMIKFNNEAPTGKPLFQGKGVVSFNHPSRAISLDNRSFAFASNFAGRPSLVFGRVEFTESDSHLRLEGSADLPGGLILPAHLGVAANNTLELDGDFLLRAPRDEINYQLAVPRVENHGLVQTPAPEMGSFSNLYATVGNFVWENASNSTFALRNGADLSYATDNALFLNQIGATFRTSGGFDVEDNIVNWSFVNRGLIDVVSGRLRFASSFTNEPTGSFRVANGASIDFGPSSSITINGTLGGSGTLEAGTILVTGLVNPGSSPGTLNLVGNTTFSASTVFNFELGVSAKDLIAVDGNLTLDGTLNLTALSDLVTGRYTLFTYTGTLTDNGLLLGTLGSRIQSAAVIIDTANHLVAVDLVSTPVAGPRLSIRQVSSGTIQLTFPNAEGYNYTVLSSTNLSQPVAEWSVLGSATSIGGNLYQITEQIAPSEPRRFYQLRRAAP